jgi:hypothetical protein
MLTVFSLPKAFTGHIGTIQRNAIVSWTLLRPRPEIILLGNEAGTAQLARVLGLQHIPDVECNEHGTPLLSDALLRVDKVARTPLLCLINSDIILLQEFVDSVAKIAPRFPKFLAVAQRLNVEIKEGLDFAKGGEERFRSEILRQGVPGSHTAIDVFVFPAGVWREVPPLVLGRAWFDQWLIKDARRRGIPVVDVTNCARAIHQNHEYGHIANGQQGAYWGEEALHNLAIYGGVPHAYTLLSASHKLTREGHIRRVRLRQPLFRLRQLLWQMFVERTVGARHRLRLRRRFWQAGKRAEEKA